MDQAGETNWDVVIVGAGPAGSVAAALLAGRGRRVLLVDKSPWPREKACGGCLNATTVNLLRQAGLDSALTGSQPLHQVTWQVAQRSMSLPTPGGAAILRADMDSRLVDLAQQRGCTFLPNVGATLLPAAPAARDRILTLRTDKGTTMINAAAVLACDGIGGTVLAGETWADWSVEARAWIGISTTCAFWPPGLEAGIIYMHVGPGGYVGLVRLADERVHLAAALDPLASRTAGGPARLIKQILLSCGRATPLGMGNNRFRGTGELTRRRRQLGSHRVLVLGDACGYIEPFTGEGMAWAVSSACEVVDLLPDPQSPWPDDLPQRWLKRHRQVIGRSQRWCRVLKPMIHRPALAETGVTLNRALPVIGRFLASRVGRVRTRSLVLQGETR